jgi:prevent-host-death family protein
LETLDVFSVRDLRTRSGDLLRGAELGQVVLITEHGRPAILAVPFDRQLLGLGVHGALALKLYEGRHLTMAQAAKLAGMPLDEFIALLGPAGCMLSASLACYWLPGGPGVSTWSVRRSVRCRNNITGSRKRSFTRFCAWPVSSIDRSRGRTKARY